MTLLPSENPQLISKKRTTKDSRRTFVASSPKSTSGNQSYEGRHREKLKQIDIDYQKELDAIKKQEKELSERQGGKLTSEQSIEISARYTNAENERDKAISDVTKNQLKAEADAMREYLKEYGTFQQKKLP